MIDYQVKFNKLKMSYNVRLRNPGFDDIKNGRKTIEGRLNRGIFSKMKIDDEIIFVNNSDTFTVKITDIKYYESFLEMLSKEDLKKIRPNASKIADSLDLYNKYYSSNDILKYGVIAFFISF
ncbi:hypothetical protein CPAV1605_407 [seawater metagenome]|uniref:ASCH domain-containing protein n=1 Tax=seawater metagenome TaxID=1561972 RepID=A0A5E8CLI8_9ZZZZ